MNIQVIGCSHRDTPIAVRERLAFGAEQACLVLDEFRHEFAGSEAALLSTCNRTEFYTASGQEDPSRGPNVAEFLGRFHALTPAETARHLQVLEGAAAVRHFLLVASSLESLVVGETQILSQVRKAFQLAEERGTVGPILRGALQAAVRTARRVANETLLQQRRVSIPSVAVAEFARQIFDRFDDKEVLVIGAGEMAEETLKYLVEEGAKRFTVVNRTWERADCLARKWQGRARSWEMLDDALVLADMVISTSGAPTTIVSLERFRSIQRRRDGRLLLVLDLAVPRDFDPEIGRRAGVYLFSIDDLQGACEANRRQRDREIPAATRIVDEELQRLMGEFRQRRTAPIIRRFREGWEKSKDLELQRLFNRLPELDGRSRHEICRSFDRLVNKLLHPPLETIRIESCHDQKTEMIDTLSRLFRLND